MNDQEIDAVLRKALENLRAERAAGRFRRVTLITTAGTVERWADRLTRLGATEGELACFGLEVRAGPMVEVREEPRSEDGSRELVWRDRSPFPAGYRR